jgi:hypothetical protein
MSSLLKREILGTFQFAIGALTSKWIGNECSHFEWSLTILQWNEQKATTYAWAKVTLEWDHSEETTQGHEKIFKPPLVKLASKILLKILSIFNWSVGYIVWNAFFWIEKNEVLSDTILQFKLILCEEDKGGMEFHFMGVGIQQVHLTWKNVWAILDFHAL